LVALQVTQFHSEGEHGGENHDDFFRIPEIHTRRLLINVAAIWFVPI
jgi:hypothetical protein